MLRFSIHNFGCRATDADAAGLRNALLAQGFALVRAHAEANVVILNTCTVTAAADAQAREAIRKIHREKPTAHIVVTGCYAQRAPEEIAQLEGVDCVVGNSHFADIPGVIRGLFDESPKKREAAFTKTYAVEANFVPATALGGDSLSLARGPAKILTGDIFMQETAQWTSPAAAPGDRTRPILKIQDGCNKRCSYCVIPFVRGRSRSLAPETILGEIHSMVAAGSKEIVLSGINLGAYGRDLAVRVSLAELTRRILGETSLERLRFSSIEPQDVTGEFVALVTSSERIAPHFHVPLQSGSNRVLRAMHRWYRAEHYAERVHLIRQNSPDASIGADVIAGFPGETQDEFEETLNFIERLPFSYLHVFSFSERPGTEAAKLGNQVSAGEIGARARQLRELSQQKAGAFRASQEGRTLRALTLARQGDDWTEALTGNYLKIRVPGRRDSNLWCDVTILCHDAAGPIAAIASRRDHSQFAQTPYS